MSKNTHFERLLGALHVRRDRGRRKDPRRYLGRSQYNEVVVAWDGDEVQGVVLELGFELEMERDFVKANFLVK